MSNKKKNKVTFTGRHEIKYERFENDPLVTCKFLIDVRDQGRFGFGDVHHYNEKAEIYTIIDDGGEVIQRSPDMVFFPQNQIA